VPEVTEADANARAPPVEQEFLHCTRDGVDAHFPRGIVDHGRHRTGLVEHYVQIERDDFAFVERARTTVFDLKRPALARVAIVTYDFGFTTARR
jgi:hypothetical protein